MRKNNEDELLDVQDEYYGEYFENHATTINGSQEETNKMGVEPVKSLLFKMATPMIISMLVQAFYNIVDTIFVSRIKDSAGNSLSQQAIDALGMAFPFQMLLIAFGTGTCVGVNAILSKALGEKNDNKVQRAAKNGVFLAFCNAILFFLIGLFLAPKLIKAQGATGTTLEFGTKYLRIVCMCSIGVYIQFIFERLLQATGRTLCTMFTQLLGAIINIVLDPILIFGLFGMPKLGVSGAAIATVVGQICAGILAVILNKIFNKEVRLSWKGFRPEGKLILDIYRIGIPSIIMQAIGSVMTFSMNKILGGIDELGVTIFTIYFKIQSFFFMPLFGLNNALIPILSFNFGAKKRKRMVEVIKITMIFAFCIMLVGFATFEFIPDVLITIVGDKPSKRLIDAGCHAFRIIGIHYLLAWFCIISGTVFQSVGISWHCLIVSVARQLVVLVPAAFILSRIGGISMVWWCFPFAEVMSLIVSSIFLIWTVKNVIMKVPE